jgi:hypothetical protein
MQRKRPTTKNQREAAYLADVLSCYFRDDCPRAMIHITCPTVALTTRRTNPIASAARLRTPGGIEYYPDERQDRSGVTR